MFGGSTPPPPPMSYTKSQLEDYKKWYVYRPEDGFSPERNKRVIEYTIAKSKLLKERRNRDYIEQIRERADAVATYLRAVDRGKEPNVDRYFGKKILAYLRAQKIVAELKDRKKKLFSLIEID